MKSILLILLLLNSPLTAKELFSTYVVGEASEPQAQAKIIRNTKSKIYITKKLELAQAHVKEVRAVKEGKSGSTIYIKFSKEGKDLLHRLSKNLVGKRLAFLLDGEVIMVPQIYEPIYQEEISIFGKFTYEEAEKLAVEINKSTD